MQQDAWPGLALPCLLSRPNRAAKHIPSEQWMLYGQVRLLLLAALAGEHILFIGPPGTAKSELGRRLAGLYKGTFFERLLTRFSVPEVRSNVQSSHSGAAMHSMV